MHLVTEFFSFSQRISLKNSLIQTTPFLVYLSLFFLYCKYQDGQNYKGHFIPIKNYQGEVPYIYYNFGTKHKLSKQLGTILQELLGYPYFLIFQR